MSIFYLLPTLRLLFGVEDQIIAEGNDIRYANDQFKFTAQHKSNFDRVIFFENISSLSFDAILSTINYEWYLWGASSFS